MFVEGANLHSTPGCGVENISKTGGIMVNHKLFNCKWCFWIGFLRCNIGLEDQWIVAPMNGSIYKSLFSLNGEPLQQERERQSIVTGVDYG